MSSNGKRGPYATKKNYFAVIKRKKLGDRPAIFFLPEESDCNVYALVKPGKVLLAKDAPTWEHVYVFRAPDSLEYIQMLNREQGGIGFPTNKERAQYQQGVNPFTAETQFFMVDGEEEEIPRFDDEYKRWFERTKRKPQKKKKKAGEKRSRKDEEAEEEEDSGQQKKARADSAE